MIKRLKRRFVIVNICILTCVLISILISVFIMMYSSEINLSYELMESLINQKSFGTNDPIQEDYISNKNFSDIYLMNNNYDENNFSERIFEDAPFDNPHQWDKPPKSPDTETPPPKITKPQSNDSSVFTNITTYIRQTTINNNSKTEETIKTTVSNDKKIINIDTNKTTPDKEDTVNKNITENQFTESTKSNTQKSENFDSLEKITTNSTLTKFPSNHKPDEGKPRKIEPDPFKGKVKRSNIYVEFSDINNLKKIIYQYCTSEDDLSVKSAVKKIFNDRKERGKITIGSDQYRYIFRYDPPKKIYTIIMLDRTLEINTINRLLFTFIIIAGIGMIFIVLISILLANWTIKPVSKSWSQQKEFIANASHELKTPLTVISTNTDVILANPEDTVKSQSKWLNYIKNETIRMSKLVNNLLCIAKYDANKVQLIYNKINLSNLVSSICLQYEPLIFENKKRLITDVDDSLEIIGDEDKIKQVINILMDNALKYSLKNGVIKVTLKHIKQSSIYLTVSNTSENIEKKYLDKIFDRFYRIDDSRNRKTGGSGLGLNIAKTIIESHKGKIFAVNKDNITSFIITF